MRVYGPNGTALAVARSRLPRMTRPAVPMQPGRYARTRRSMRSLPSRAWKTERRKRAVAKGRNALDVLHALKLGVLDGSVDQSMLSRLKVASEGLTDTSGDAGLDVVLGEIGLRVAVELAKAGVR
jgi:Class II flagellar assembly regulator